ncbi:unknown [Clostridium sp. CAG:967]|nr:unknown [Clostridium sp. CAG:967]
MKKFDIRKSFEIFLREPISVLTEGLFQLVNIEDNIFSKKPYVNVDFVNKKTQITVVNSEKMYNLFQKVLFRQKLKEQKEKVLTK